MTHAFTTDAGACDFHTAAVTDHTLVLSALVTAAGTFHITGRSKDAFAEKTTLLWLEGTVVDCFRVLDFTTGPALDILWAGDGDANLIEVFWLLVVKVDVRHMFVVNFWVDLLPHSIVAG